MTFPLAALLLVASASAGTLDPGFGALRSIPSPARNGSGEPHLAVSPEGVVWLSWLEKAGRSGHALRAARLEGERWSRPITVAAGDSFFVNWADFPTLLPLGGERLVAHWPWKSGRDIYAYDVRMAFSADAGRTWTGPVTPHSDGTPTEHGFVSLLPEGDAVRVVWLDGREFAKRSADSAASGHDAHVKGEMTLRTARVGADGRVTGEELLDPRVCDCCQTAAARTAAGPVVVYRDRSESEVRDHSIVRRTGRWSAPAPIGADGWEIGGCPVNGPAIDAAGAAVVVGWFTAARDSARVRVAFSDDSGAAFGAPLRVDGGDPVGRVDVVLLEDGSALVTWVENEPGGRTARIEARRVTPGGGISAPLTVVRTRAARASGFPRVVRSGDRLIFAWTEAGGTARVRTVVARLGERQSRGAIAPK